MRVIILVACCLAMAMGEGGKRDREGRLFLVSSSTTTSILTTSSICYTTGAALTACTGKRKKRQLIVDPIADAEYSLISAASSRDYNLDGSAASAPGSKREGKFLMYWMTTTSTTTTTTYSTTVTLSAIECTPSNFIYTACG